MIFSCSACQEPSIRQTDFFGSRGNEMGRGEKGGAGTGEGGNGCINVPKNPLAQVSVYEQVCCGGPQTPAFRLWRLRAPSLGTANVDHCKGLLGIDCPYFTGLSSSHTPEQIFSSLCSPEIVKMPPARPRLLSDVAFCSQNKELLAAGC